MRYLLALSFAIAVISAACSSDSNPSAPLAPSVQNDSLDILTPPTNTGTLDGLYVGSWLGLHEIAISPQGCSMMGVMRVTDLRVNGTRVWFSMRDPWGWSDPVEKIYFNGYKSGDQIIGHDIWLNGSGDYGPMWALTFIKQ